MKKWFVVGVVCVLCFGCGDPAAENNAENSTSEECGANMLPDGSASVTISGAEMQQVDITLACGTPEDGNGLLPLHAPPSDDDPKQLQISFNEGQDWLLRVSAVVDPIEPGSYALIGTPDEGFGVFNIPMGVDGMTYSVESGTLEITAVEMLTIGPTQWAVIDGSVESSGEGVSSSVTFENVPVRVFVEQ